MVKRVMEVFEALVSGNMEVDVTFYLLGLYAGEHHERHSFLTLLSSRSAKHAAL